LHVHSRHRALAAQALLLTRVLILADDLTGAADAAAAFLGRARRLAVALSLSELPAAEVVAVDLATRSGSERTARRVVRAAFSSACARRAGIVFKKIDSTLRGHVAAEFTALGRIPTLFTPAFPAQGRTVRNNRIFVNGKLVRGTPRLPILDAESDADLDAIARAGMLMHPRPLFVGSAGLARALARTLRPARAAPRGRVPRAPILTVIGSASPVSARQGDALPRRANVTRVALRPRDLRVGGAALSDAGAALEQALGADRDALLQIEWTRQPTAADHPLATELGRLVARYAPHAHYVLTGGETARAVLSALGVGVLRMLGEVDPGVPYGAAASGALVCTKAGGFGDPQTLVRCVARLKREMKRR